MPVDLIDLYQNKAVFIINNGPSFQGVDQDKLKQPGIITYGLNNGAHSFRPNLWSCVDDPTRFMRSIWSDPTITKIVPRDIFERPIWNTSKDTYSKDLVGDFPNVFGFKKKSFILF